VIGKLAAIYVLDLLVTASIVVSFIGDKATQIDFSQKELEGTAIFAPARTLYADLLHDFRGAPGSQAALALAFAATDAAQRQHGADMDLGAGWNALAAAASRYEAAPQGAEREAAFGDYQDRLGDFLATVGDRSNLILDPDLDSYYSMAIVVVHMRDLVKGIQQLSTVAATAPEGEGRTIQLSSLEAEIGRTRASIRRSIEAGASGNADGRFIAALGPPQRDLDAALDGLFKTVDGGGDVPSASGRALDTAFACWSATTVELDRLLHARILGLYHDATVKLGITLVLAILVLCAVTFIGLQIARPVHELASVAASFRSGDPRRAVWDSSDEFGGLVTAFNAMLDRLAEEGQRREEIAAAAHAAEAQRDLLEAIALPVIVTSLDGATLLHANAAARTLLGARIERGFAGLDSLVSGRGAAIIESLAAGGAVDEMEVAISGQHGAAGWMLLSARRVEYRGQEVALLGLTPVNELKRTQAALNEAKEAAEINAERLRATTETLMASIRYASRIQHSIFPDRAAVLEMTHGVEIWVEQRDIVGGDWHWVGRFEEGELVFLCDCTGHGVPGALMTMLVSSCFRRVIEEQGYVSPARILTALHRQVRAALSRASGEHAADDGLDAACVFLDHEAGTARVASARLSLLHVDESGLHEIKGDRTSIGYPSLAEQVAITEHEIPVAAGDQLYLFTDGCTDQIGGDTRVLFGRRRLMATIEKLRLLPPAEQIARLRGVLAEYRGSEPVRDDASLIILRLNDAFRAGRLPAPDVRAIPPVA